MIRRAICNKWFLSTVTANQSEGGHLKATDECCVTCKRRRIVCFFLLFIFFFSSYVFPSYPKNELVESKFRILLLPCQQKRDRRELYRASGRMNFSKRFIRAHACVQWREYLKKARELSKVFLSLFLVCRQCK